MIPDYAAQTKRPPLINFRRLGLALLIVVAAFAVIYPFSPAAVQERNMAKANVHQAKILAVIGNDRRFDHVDVKVTTAELGCLWVGGPVRSADDQTALRHIIDESKPPVRVLFKVGVMPAAEVDREPPERSVSMTGTTSPAITP